MGVGVILTLVYFISKTLLIILMTAAEVKS